MVSQSAPKPEAGTPDFWFYLDQLVNYTTVVIDRPRGSRHPRFSAVIYPLDYGHLRATRASDGAGIDVWIGTQPQRCVTGVVITVDLKKHDAEIKILLGCTGEEARAIVKIHNRGAQAATLLMRYSTFDDNELRNNTYPHDRQRGPS